MYKSSTSPTHTEWERERERERVRETDKEWHTYICVCIYLYVIMNFVIYIYIYIYIYMRSYQNGWRKGLMATTQECCNQSWTSPGDNTLQSRSYTATNLPSWKLSKLNEPDIQNTAGEAVMFSYWPPQMVELKQGDQREPTYSSFVRIRDIAMRTCQKRWTIGRSSERGTTIFVLVVWHDDDDHDDNIMRGTERSDNRYAFRMIYAFSCTLCNTNVQLRDFWKYTNYNRFSNIKNYWYIICFYWILKPIYYDNQAPPVNFAEKLTKRVQVLIIWES